MIRIIKSHNELNGLKFVIFEFGLMALLLIAFAVYCLLRQRLVLGVFFGGVGLNCLPVAYYSLRALQKGEGGSGTIWNPQARERLIAKNPHMLRDTLTLAGATLLPLLVLVFVVVETLHAGEAVYNNRMNSILRKKRLPGGQTLQIVQGDITLETVDAIVNAANNQLEHGGGVAAAISRAGGPKIQVESGVWVREHGAVSHAEPAYTTAGNLPCRYVIHAVGPVWGDGDEDHKLAAAVRGSLWRADELKLTSIALPAISTGIFRFPKERAAKIIFAAIEAYFSEKPDATVKLVRVTLFDTPTIQAFVAVWDS